MSSVSRRSTAMCTSSSASVGTKAPDSISRPTAARPSSMASSSSALRTPAPRQRPGVRDRALDVLGPEAPVEGQRAVQRHERRARSPAKRPERATVTPSVLRRRAGGRVRRLALVRARPCPASYVLRTGAERAAATRRPPPAGGRAGRERRRAAALRRPPAPPRRPQGRGRRQTVAASSSISSSFIMWCSLPTRAHTSIGRPHSSMKPSAAVCENSSSSCTWRACSCRARSRSCARRPRSCPCGT